METLKAPLEKAFVAMGIITWIAGGGVLAIGLLLMLDSETFDQVKLLSTTTMWDAVIFMTVAVGGYTFVIGFVGWIGYLFRNRNALLAYIVLGSIAGAVLLTSGFLALVYKLDVSSDETNRTLYESLNNGNTSAWNDYQQTFSCCGVQSAHDWPNVPSSCCLNANGTCTNSTAFTTGCYEIMKDGINFDTALIMGLSFGVFSTQLISTSLGGVLYGSDNAIHPAA